MILPFGKLNEVIKLAESCFISVRPKQQHEFVDHKLNNNMVS